MTNHCFITGANRGIGLGLCRDFLASGFHVIAGSRDPEATTLKELGRQYPGQLSSIKLPMDQLSDIDRAIAGLPADVKFSVVINNAGVCLDYGQRLADLSCDDLGQSFQVNAIAPVAIVQGLQGHLAPGAKIINISSRLGSQTLNVRGDSYGYRMSKAALNTVTRCLAAELDHVITVSLHPGKVQTDMLAPSDDAISVEDSCRGLMKVISQLGIEDTGKFYSYLGEEIPW